MTQSANGQQIEFVVTGNFSSLPTRVTSIPVEWSVQLMATPPQQYALTTQTFLFECTGSGPFPIVAYAPSDPNAALSGSWSSARMIQASTVITCLWENDCFPLRLSRRILHEGYGLFAAASQNLLMEMLSDHWCLCRTLLSFRVASALASSCRERPLPRYC